MIHSLIQETHARYRALEPDATEYGLDYHLFEVERALRNLEAYTRSLSAQTLGAQSAGVALEYSRL
jgi:hypothetical protein